MKNSFYLLFIFFAFSCSQNTEREEAVARIDSLEKEIEQLKIANDTLSEQALRKAYVARNYSGYFDSISNPEEFLLDQLRKKPELIPKKPVLGGRMRFTGISFINDELFVAADEDGHIMGKTVYKYSMDRQGKLRFEIVGNVE